MLAVVFKVMAKAEKNICIGHLKYHKALLPRFSWVLFGFFVLVVVLD
jgi:hypothetical protein